MCWTIFSQKFINSLLHIELVYWWLFFTQIVLLSLRCSKTWNDRVFLQFQTNKKNNIFYSHAMSRRPNRIPLTKLGSPIWFSTNLAFLNSVTCYHGRRGTPRFESEFYCKRPKTTNRHPKTNFFDIKTTNKNFGKIDFFWKKTQYMAWSKNPSIRS
jgi:hypothetical protein